MISPVPNPLSALSPLSKLPPAMSPIKYSSPRKLHLPPADQIHNSLRSSKSRDCTKLAQLTTSNDPHTSNDDQSSRPSKYFLRPHTRRDY